MKVLFKNTTRYSSAIYETFLAFHQKKYHMPYQFYTALVFFIFLFCITLQLWYRAYALAFLTASMLTFFITWRLLHPVKEIQKERGSKKITEEKQYCFVFYENYFEIWDKNQYYVGKYFQLHKVWDTPDFFYLYPNKNRAFLLDKQGFSVGTAIDFSKFMKQKCWFCFHKETTATSKTNKE